MNVVKYTITPMENSNNSKRFGKKILLVDDDIDISKVVTIILENNGYEVFTHTTGMNVNEVVEKNEPQLIILDISLPGKLGTEVCREIKEIYSIPIIFFSAHADKGSAYEKCKADGFIQKPFDIKKMLKTIDFFLR